MLWTGEGGHCRADYMVGSEESVHGAVLVRLVYTLLSSCGCCSVPKSCLTLQPYELQHTRVLVPHHLPEFAQVLGSVGYKIKKKKFRLKKADIRTVKAK